MGELIKRVERPRPCHHDAPGALRRWRMGIWLGSQWRCGKCNTLLVLDSDYGAPEPHWRD